jgi:DNA processing protein
MTKTIPRRAFLSWARSGVLSPARFWPALREAGGWEPLLAASGEELASRLRSPERVRALLTAVDDREADRWAEAVARRSGLALVTPADPEYPVRLAEISDPPFALFAAGSLARLKAPAVGIVGSRNASRYGREVAARLGRDLSAAGVAVVSGFARGIDTAAHESAASASEGAAGGGAGGTLAVLGCGLDVDYPRENAALKRALVAGGHLLLSEFPTGSEPRPENFPIRNRIIAGLSAGVVVVEASRRSGSLITARLAADFGRDVFAVPGSVFSETSIGCHELLRDGAILCRGAEDVLAELFPSVGPARPAVPASPAVALDLSREAKLVLAALARDGASSPDDLAMEADLPAATVLAALFELEQAGLAVSGDSGEYGLVR